MQNLRIMKKWVKKFTKFYNTFYKVNFESSEECPPRGAHYRDYSGITVMGKFQTLFLVEIPETKRFIPKGFELGTTLN